jgi:hypothetical protein
MSLAPLPPLRSLWALGGAPSAFVRRDERLRERLERLLAQADAAGRFADDRALDRLGRAFDFADVLPGEPAGAPASEEALGPRPRAGPQLRRPWLEGGPGQGREYDDRPEDPATSSADDIDRTSQEAFRPAADPGKRLHAPPRRTPATGSPAFRNTSPGVGSTPAAAQGRGTGFSAAGAAARWPAVAPIRLEPDDRVSAMVAALLEVADRADPGVRSVGAAPTTGGTVPPAGARGPGSSPADAAAPPPAPTSLSMILQRVEAVLTMRRDRRTGHELGEDVASDRSPRGIGEQAASHPTRRPDEAMGIGAHPAVGLRGLAERTDATLPIDRAPFLHGAAGEQEARWPDSALDRFASLVDEAARHEGVPLEEGLT